MRRTDDSTGVSSKVTIISNRNKDEYFCGTHPPEPPPVPEPFVLVGYEPPAGEPGVDDGEESLKQSFEPGLTINTELPAVPNPRSSPPVRITVVPDRTEGFQSKPKPCSATVVSVP